ncbi:MAG: hypothetical protein ACE145_15800 [Terriglobia bacterium]
MATTSKITPAPAKPVRGQIIEAEIKSTVDATRPLPLVCGLYAVETPEGVWLCAYYGMNRSVFDFLPQKGAAVDESKLGIVFHHKEFVAKDQYQPAVWDEFKKQRMMAYGGHGE